MGYESVPGPEIADALDTAEYLLVLIMQSDDKTVVFREHLESLAQGSARFRFARDCFDGL